MQDGRSERRRDHQQVVDRHAEIAGGELAVDQITLPSDCGLAPQMKRKHVLEHQDQGERQQQLEALVAVVDGAQQPLDRRARRRRAATPATSSTGRSIHGGRPCAASPA